RVISSAARRRSSRPRRTSWIPSSSPRSRAGSARRCAASPARRSPRANALPSSVGDRLARAGVLGLQGDFREHLDTFQRLGTEAIDVRRPEQLDEIDALVIPGGESTTIGKLAAHYGFIPKLKER